MTLRPPDLQLLQNHPHLACDADCPDFIRAGFHASPFLHHLVQTHPEWLVWDESAVIQKFDSVMRAVDALDDVSDEQTFMHRSRLCKNQAMLLIGVADFSGFWDFTEICRRLSRLADGLIAACLRFACRQMQVCDKDDLSDCGFVVIAFGKLGADELNYSSDVDLLLLYDTEKFLPDSSHRREQKILRFTHYLLHLVQQRLPSGYLFRVDLRLRPNPSSTPPAMSIGAALVYYESIARNWERMVMIRARPVAGDIALGDEFLQQISPFVWRRFLDYESLRDIYDLQKPFFKTLPERFFGYNVKKDAGGIRTCEFTIQLMQLLWGGKRPELRTAGTLQSLTRLNEAMLISSEAAEDLRSAYVFLRSIEHRLQMQNDLQIQTLPTEKSDFAVFAHFTGYPDSETLHQDLRAVTARAQKHWTHLPDIFGHRPKPSSAQAREIFRSENLTPENINAHLQSLGFSTPESVAQALVHWHTGNIRATASTRARTLLDDLLPELLQNLGSTLNPDQAFFAFDRFLTSLPSGIQLFSLFAAHRPLMRIIADIMGNAPELALNLSSHPNLLEVFLEVIDNFENLSQARQVLSQSLAPDRHYEDTLSALREFTQRRQFHTSCHLLNRQMTIHQAAQNLTLSAEAVTGALVQAVRQVFAEKHGSCGEFAVIAMGKFGGQLLLPHSDLDLVFLYQNESPSDGSKSLFPGPYYEKFTQRLMTALTVPTASGELYDIDCRLRPWGSDGPAAHSWEQYRRYYRQDARHWEKMALSRARVIYTASDDFRTAIDSGIAEILCQAAVKRQRHHKNVAAMRKRIAEIYPPQGDFDVKYQYGGLLDLEFVLQSLYLQALADGIEFADNQYCTIIAALTANSILSADEAQTLSGGLDFYLTTQALLRLMHLTPEDLQKTPKKHFGALAAAMGCDSFDDCRRQCRDIAAHIRDLFAKFVTTPIGEDS